MDPKKDSDIYIDRKKDLDTVLNRINDLNYYAIIAPRQTGKTTFLQQLINKINEDDLIRLESIYITLEDLVNVNSDRFYFNFARKIIRYISTNYSIYPESMESIHESVESNLDLEDFFIKLSEAQFSPKENDYEIIFHPSEDRKGLKFVICIDEIDAIPDKLALEFLKTLRAIFEQRSFIKGYDSFSFIISGAVDLAKLTYGKSSPFNIATDIHLSDFKKDEMASMIEKTMKEVEVRYYEGFIDDLFGATNGHPYLTQKLCGKLLDNLISERRFLIEQNELAREIENLINGNDWNLKTTLEKVLENNQQDVLLRILKGEKIKYNQSDNFSYALKLAGALVNEKEEQDNGTYKNHSKTMKFCEIRNPIYKQYFYKYFNME
ncbi:MAG: AAA-like domain-containing protein [bacterium]